MKSFQFSCINKSLSLIRGVPDIKHSEVVHLDEVGPAVLEFEVFKLGSLNVRLDESLSRESSEMLPKHDIYSDVQAWMVV